MACLKLSVGHLNSGSIVQMTVASRGEQKLEGGAEKNPQAESDCDELSCKQTFIFSS